jgi:acetamidase/formamidase
MKDAIATLIIGLGMMGAAGAHAATYQLRAGPETVTWGFYAADREPALRLASGDTVEIETVMTGSRLMRQLGLPESLITADMEAIQAEVAEEGPHLLVGPIEVAGAKPGDVLEVRILDMTPATDWAVNAIMPGSGALPDEFPQPDVHLVPLDLERSVAAVAPGVEVPIRPFFGSIGVAPPSGRVPSGPPGRHTGNLDNKELVAGSTLYLPVLADGALLLVGDGHVAQGDGEVNGLALEASVKGRLQIILRRDMSLEWPRAETPTHFVTMGLDPDLDRAAVLAVREMIDFLVATKGLSRNEAYVVCSAAVDLRVTQIVDGTKGIHAMLPKSIFRDGAK